MDITLSILVPTVPERWEEVQRLSDELCRQALDYPVEVLVFMDNRRRSTGAKRNTLVSMARGQYVTFVDDDDWVEPNYVKEIILAIENHPGVSCIVFDAAYYLNGAFQKTFRYGQEYGWEVTPDTIYREPNQWMCWARWVMENYPYGDQAPEDSRWIADGPWKHETISQARIAKPLYHYRAVPGHD